MTFAKLLTAAIVLAGGVAAAARAGNGLTIAAGAVVMPDGSLSGPMLVVVSGERISEVRAGTQDTPAAGMVDRRDAVLCPGMIDVRSSLGVVRRGNDVERTRAVDPELSIRESIDLEHDDFRLALESGVTAALVLPAGNNIVGGTAQAVRLGPGGRVEWLRDQGPLVFALGQSMLEGTREPTSRIGAVHLLRESLAAVKNDGGAPRIRAFLKSGLDGLLLCEEEEDVSAAAREFGAAGRLPLLSWTPVDAASALEFMQPFPDPLLVGPFTFETSARVLRGPGLLQQAGRELAFAAALPRQPGESLRISAALAVRYGMDAAAARRALTVNAAKAAGVVERIGAIQPGKDADFVIYSADPLRLEARVCEVYVKGVKVYDASLH